MPVEGWRSVSVRNELYEALEKKAKKDNRNLTNELDTILREILEVAA